ncbi:MAG TPA: S8 family serine peptidase [Streptosporangiaceae bacterium]
MSRTPIITAKAAGAATASGASRLLLLNGDRLAVSTAGGQQRIADLPAARPDAVLGIRFGSQVSEVPEDALPYLNRALSPSLFDVSALQHAEAGGRLPVRLTFTGRRPAVPGITITRSAAGQAAGYLTASSARRFGSALMRQFRADQSAGRFGAGGLFGHDLTISLPGASGPAPAPANPAFKMSTLTVRGTNLRGKPQTGADIFILNADSFARFEGLQETDNFLVHGVAKFSVPVGHYWMLATFFRFTRTGGSLRMVVLPQFSVGAGRSTVHVAETAASSKVTTAVSRPVNIAQQGFEVLRRDAHGSSFSFDQTWSGLSGFVSPTSRKPTVGTLRTFTSATLVSPRKSSSSYAYNLDFPGPAGIIPSQHFTVPDSSLATVTERYFRDLPARNFNAGWASAGGTLAQFGGIVFFSILPLSMPQVQTQFFNTGPGLVWQNLAFPELNSFFFGITDDFRSYEPGEHQVQNWNNYPLHPAPDVVSAGAAAAFPTLASAFRTGNTLNFSETPFTDNQPGHVGEGLLAFGGGAKASGSFAVDQNGKLIAHGKLGFNGVPPVQLIPNPSSIRLTLNAQRSGPGLRLSTASQTTWTWKSVRNTTATVPKAWFCGFSDHFTRLNRRCAAQPLLAVNYDVAAMSLAGLTKPGAQTVTVTAGHVQPVAATAITGLTAQFSLNDGDSWTPATATAEGSGRFGVSFSAPSGVDVSLRIKATDAAGGTIEETIPRAYGVSGPAAAPFAAAGGKQLARSRAVHTMSAVGPAAGSAAGPAGGAGLQAACPAVAAPLMRCFTLYRPQLRVNRSLAAGKVSHPVGWSPKTLERAYRLPVSRRSHQTVAVSIAFHTPKLASYLATYRHHYGLPPCTTASGCLRIVNQNGKAKPQAPSGLHTGWDLEATLDVSMISAACPHCKILVVEANSPSLPDLGKTDVTAARMGAQVISNSYGQRENGEAMRFAKDYRRAGHTVVVSSGDFGFDAANFPANLGVVTAVGGTSLHRAHNARGFSERVWDDPAIFGAGSSGCSAYVRKPSWQHDNHCPGRTVADISAVASNVPIFNAAYGGWVTVAGTSASAPFVAGTYGLAGNASHLTPRWLYLHRHDFFDVTAGNNALIGGTPKQVCGDDYLCKARKGYDAPTGLGTPDGIAGL